LITPKRRDTLEVMSSDIGNNGFHRHLACLKRNESADVRVGDEVTR
jgi:hypothetical protein